MYTTAGVNLSVNDTITYNMKTNNDAKPYISTVIVEKICQETLTGMIAFFVKISVGSAIHSDMRVVFMDFSGLLSIIYIFIFCQVLLQYNAHFDVS